MNSISSVFLPTKPKGVRQPFLHFLRPWSEPRGVAIACEGRSVMAVNLQPLPGDINHRRGGGDGSLREIRDALLNRSIEFKCPPESSATANYCALIERASLNLYRVLIARLPAKGAKRRNVYAQFFFVISDSTKLYTLRVSTFPFLITKLSRL